MVVDRFVDSPDNANSAGPTTDFAISRLAFLGVVAKSVEFHYDFASRVWYFFFMAYPDSAKSVRSTTHLAISWLAFLGLVKGCSQHIKGSLQVMYMEFRCILKSCQRYCISQAA